MDILKVFKDLQIDNVSYIKELKGGLRCSSYLFVNENEKKVIQLYEGNLSYQSSKKAFIYNMLNKNNSSLPIPKVIKFGEKEDYSYLITSYIEGQTIEELKGKEEFSVEYILKNLAEVLSCIYSVDVGNSFGWIGEEDIPQDQTLEEYLNSELDRFEETMIEGLNDEEIKQVMEFGKNTVSKIVDKYCGKPVLCWYDINRNNIVVNYVKEKYYELHLIDSGAVRFGVPEWDFAFMKVNLFKNDCDFTKLLNYYTDLGNEIDLELVEEFRRIVELDDLTLQINDKQIYYIPKNSTFKDILLRLKEKYEKND